jgi:hypothetical protein
LLLLPFVSPSRDGKSSSNMEILQAHRDALGELFIRTRKPLLALMNSAPAELLHLLVYAALQPSLAMHISGKNRRNGQKKRRQHCRRRNTVSKTPNHFSKKKPPCPTRSNAAALAE